MTRQEKLSTAEEQNVTVATIYQRETYGWTDEEIRRGQRGHRLNISKFARENNIPVTRLYSRRARGWTDEQIRESKLFDTGKIKYIRKYDVNGKALFLVLILDVISSILRTEGNYKMACLVYRGLQDRGV